MTLRGERGEPGLRGHRGDPGPVGKQGARGVCFDHIQIIKLPVHVVTVTGDWHEIVNTRRVMGLVKDFYSELGIDVQDSHSSRLMGTGMYLTYEDDSLGHWHYDASFGVRLTLYIDPEAQSVGLGYMGQVADITGPYGTAIIAGAHGDAYTAQIMGHELGHLLGLDHEQGTFLSANINDSNLVTTAQREALRVGAYEFGSY